MKFHVGDLPFKVGAWLQSGKNTRRPSTLLLPMTQNRHQSAVFE
jgi:hypothetical protein